MLAKIELDQKMEEEKEKQRMARAAASMKEVLAFNDQIKARKLEELELIKQEEEAIVQYQKRKDDELLKLEVQAAERKHQEELRWAQLRKMQEKASSNKEALDGLRAKRAVESRERKGEIINR